MENNESNGKEKRPLYEIIFLHYKELIQKGILSPGERLPSESEISNQFQVSRITAVRALKELENRNLIQRVQGSGSFVENLSLNTPSSGDQPLSIISLVMPFEDTYFADVLSGVEDVARELGYFVTTHNTCKDSKREQEIIEEIIARGSHGIMVYPSSPYENVDLYSGLIIDRYPFLVIDSKLQGIETSLVEVDNEDSFYKITKHLLNMGHRRVIFVGTWVAAISSEQERYQGFCRAHMESRVPLLKKHLYQHKDGSSMPQSYYPELSQDERECNLFFDSLEQLSKEERPTAIATVNDELAALLISVAHQRGLSIPETYAITGFDNLPLSTHTTPPITTMKQPSYEIGKAAATELFRIIEEPTRPHKIYTLPGTLIERASTRPPKGADTE